MKNTNTSKNIVSTDFPLITPEYKKDRSLFIFESGTHTTILFLTTGAFLVGFAKYLGVDFKKPILIKK